MVVLIPIEHSLSLCCALLVLAAGKASVVVRTGQIFPAAFYQTVAQQSQQHSRCGFLSFCEGSQVLSRADDGPRPLNFEHVKITWFEPTLKDYEVRREFNFVLKRWH